MGITYFMDRQHITYFMDGQICGLCPASSWVKPQVRVALLMEALWIFEEALSRPWKSAGGFVSVAFVSHLYKALTATEVDAGRSGPKPTIHQHRALNVSSTSTSTSSRNPDTFSTSLKPKRALNSPCVAVRRTEVTV